jgi:hypothetical protein
MVTYCWGWQQRGAATARQARHQPRAEPAPSPARWRNWRRKPEKACLKGPFYGPFLGAYADAVSATPPARPAMPAPRWPPSKMARRANIDSKALPGSPTGCDSGWRRGSGWFEVLTLPPAPQWMAELIGRSQFCVRHQSLGYALNSDNKCLSFCVIAAHRHQGVALHQHETDGTVVLIATLFADMAGRRAFEPSNLQATSLRYHPRMVSGRAMVATSARALRLSR